MVWRRAGGEAVWFWNSVGLPLVRSRRERIRWASWSSCGVRLGIFGRPLRRGPESGGLALRRGPPRPHTRFVQRTPDPAQDDRRGRTAIRPECGIRPGPGGGRALRTFRLFDRLSAFHAGSRRARNVRLVGAMCWDAGTGLQKRQDFST